jgi:hypothetical protein
VDNFWCLPASCRKKKALNKVENIAARAKFRMSRIKTGIIFDKLYERGKIKTEA